MQESRIQKSGVRIQKSVVTLKTFLARSILTSGFCLLTSYALQAQSLTQISDTLYNADGTKASGRIVISWDPFTTSDNSTIDGGTFSYTIPASGVDAGKVDVSLAPNAGATPAGTSYRVRYYLANGASYTETWVVPATGPVAIREVRVTVPPTPSLTINGSTQLTGVVPLANGGTNQTAWAADRCVRVNSAGDALESAAADCGTGGGGGGHTIEEEGSSLTPRGSLNFVGAAITATDDAGNDQTDVAVVIDDSTVPNTITLDSITQISARAIGDTTGDLAASRVDDGGVPATQVLFSGAGAAAGFRAISDGDIPAEVTRDAEVNVQGTANEISSSGPGVAPTLSLPATIDLGGKTSFEIPNGATLTTDTFGEIAGDDDAWATGRGAVQAYDGTANTFLVGVLSSDIPANGQVPKWNTGGAITWEEDATGVGGGDAVSVNGTGVTDADLDDSTPAAPAGGVNVKWQTSGSGPADVSAYVPVSPNSSTTVVGTGRSLTGGAGIAALGDLSQDRTISTDSSEADFVKSGALACGVGTQGKVQVHTTPLQYCDNAATPALQYAAYGDSSGNAVAGDSATAFFSSGTVEDARLSANVSLLGQDIGLGSEVSGILPGANGGTNNGFMDFTGPATTLKTFTLPNASATILTTNAAVTVAQGGSGAATLTGVLIGNGTSAFTAFTSSTVGQVARVTGSNTYAWGALDLADADAITGDIPDANLSAAVTLLGSSIGAGEYDAASIDGDDINSSIAGTGLTLTAASPDTLDCDAISTTAVGCVEAAIASEIDTGTSTSVVMTPGAFADSTVFGMPYKTFQVFNSTDTVVTGDQKFVYPIPDELVGMNIVAVQAWVFGASSAGGDGAVNVDLATCRATATGDACSGTVVDVLSTNLTLDQSESKSDTAAAAAVIAGANDDVQDGDYLRVDVDLAGTSVEGLWVKVRFAIP